jgi:hypothetical protein
MRCCFLLFYSLFAARCLLLLVVRFSLLICSRYGCCWSLVVGRWSFVLCGLGVCVGFCFWVFASGASDKCPPFIFASSKKRWPPNPTAEPEVQAVHLLRHPLSARKSQLHPSLRLFHAEPCCLRPAGSIRCLTISGCTRFFNRFWI